MDFRFEQLQALTQYRLFERNGASHRFRRDNFPCDKPAASAVPLTHLPAGAAREPLVPPYNSNTVQQELDDVTKWRDKLPINRYDLLDSC